MTCTHSINPFNPPAMELLMPQRKSRHPQPEGGYQCASWYLGYIHGSANYQKKRRWEHCTGTRDRVRRRKQLTNTAKSFAKQSERWKDRDMGKRQTSHRYESVSNDRDERGNKDGEMERCETEDRVADAPGTAIRPFPWPPATAPPITCKRDVTAPPAPPDMAPQRTTEWHTRAGGPTSRP